MGGLQARSKRVRRAIAAEGAEEGAREGGQAGARGARAARQRRPPHPPCPRCMQHAATPPVRPAAGRQAAANANEREAVDTGGGRAENTHLWELDMHLWMVRTLASVELHNRVAMATGLVA